MNLFIKHKKPLIHCYSGKWTLETAPTLFFFILENNKRKYVDLQNDVQNYVRNITIDNPNKTGEVKPEEDAIIYSLNMEEHNLKVVEVPNFDNLIFIQFNK